MAAAVQFGTFRFRTKAGLDVIRAAFIDNVLASVFFFKQKTAYEIMLHEMFHGVQPQLGLAVGILENEHLDALDGRYWLQLEWRALARALTASGVQRNAAVRDAPAFRQERRRIYPAGTEDERGRDIHEGG